VPAGVALALSGLQRVAGGKRVQQVFVKVAVPRNARPRPIGRSSCGARVFHGLTGEPLPDFRPTWSISAAPWRGRSPSPPDPAARASLLVGKLIHRRIILGAAGNHSEPACYRLFAVIDSDQGRMRNQDGGMFMTLA